MTALHRVKAYFGMVPADELDAYDGYGSYDGDADRGDADHRVDRRRDRHDDRHDDRYDRGHDARYDGDERPGSRRRTEERPDRAVRAEDAEYDHGGGRADRTEASRPRTPRPRDPDHGEHSSPAAHSQQTAGRREEPDAVDATSRTPRGRGWAHNTGPNHTSVRSGPAVSGGRSSSAAASAVPALSPVPSSPRDAGPARGSLAVDTPARSRGEPDAPAPAEITSLQPKSYNEARVIGERYRDGIPVIMNLSDMDDAAAKRLVDFAAGLAFALRGSIEKVTSRVFLLSPPNVEVSPSDRRMLAENGYSVRS